MRALTLCALLSLPLLSIACGRTTPPVASQAALYRDLERLVALREAAGWQIDRLAIAALLPDALMSVCRVNPDDRAALLVWLESRIDTLGGPVDAAYRARGHKLSSVAALLQATRIRDALRAAIDTAEQDCPFWLEPEAHFAGRQISDGRWQFTAGGGGKAILVRSAGAHDINFGGASRLVAGKNIGSRWGLYLGAEVGGSAGFPPGDGGDRDALVLALDLVAPVVLRYSFVNTYVELEAGYLAHLTETDWTEVSHGFRVGASVGGRASRVRWFFPGAAFGVSYERAYQAESTLHALKLGFRVAFDLDL